MRFPKPDHDIFCAKRAWDQRAERGYMKEIEDEFQSVASKVIDGVVSKIGEVEKDAVDHFYALWHMRARHRTLPSPHYARQVGECGLDG